MPCYDGRRPDPDDQAEIDRLRKDVDTLTDMLCRLGRKYKTPAAAKADGVPDDIINWWMKHAASDHRAGRPWGV